MTEIELNAAERKVLCAMYEATGGEAGDTGHDDESLVRVTGLTAQEVFHATYRLMELGFISRIGKLA
jgi:hypothetical protein